MIDSFKKFIEKTKKIKPALIPVAPVHGAHSKPKKKLKEEVTEPHRKAGDKHVAYSEWLNHNDNHHLGNDYHEADAKLHDHHWDKVEEHKHLHNYTTDSSRVNNYLLHKAKGTKPSHFNQHSFESDDDHRARVEKHLKHHHEMIEGIDHVMKHSKLEHDVHVYHGTDAWHPGELASEHPERKVRSASYMSTSIRKHIAASFSSGGYSKHGNHILHIHLKKGQHAKYIGKHSHFSTEHEVLLPRNTTLKIHHKPTVLSSGTHVWHAHVTDEKHD